jgi:hypothetical protein
MGFIQLKEVPRYFENKILKVQLESMDWSKAPLNKNLYDHSQPMSVISVIKTKQ